MKRRDVSWWHTMAFTVIARLVAGKCRMERIARNPPAASRQAVLLRPSLRRGLGVHVDDLDAAVDRVHRCARILWPALAVADGDEVGAGDAELFAKVALDGIGAALGEVLIIGVAADRIGVTGDHEC